MEKEVGVRYQEEGDGMWVKVHLLIIMCFPGLWEEWAGLLRSGRQESMGSQLRASYTFIWYIFILFLIAHLVNQPHS